MKKPTNNIVNRFEPDEDDVLVQPDDPDAHFVDGEDEIDWEVPAGGLDE